MAYSLSFCKHVALCFVDYLTAAMDNCRHIAALTVAADSSVLNPQKWACQICGTTESIWVYITYANYRVFREMIIF